MYKFLLLGALFLFPGIIIAAPIVGVVKDLSQLPGDKFFVIQHADGTKTDLIYPETTLLKSDQIVFPDSLKSDSPIWVEVQVGRNKNHKLTLHDEDSPWLIPDDNESLTERVSSLYKFLVIGSDHKTFVQGKSRSSGPQSLPLDISLDIVDDIQLVDAKDDSIELFWLGGLSPYSLTVVSPSGSSKNVENFNTKKAKVAFHSVYTGKAPLIREQCLKGPVQYQITDAYGESISVSILCQRVAKNMTIEQMLAQPDGYELSESSSASFRLMLWNAIRALPETSMRRGMITQMLVKGDSLHMNR